MTRRFAALLRSSSGTSRDAVEKLSKVWYLLTCGCERAVSLSSVSLEAQRELTTGIRAAVLPVALRLEASDVVVANRGSIVQAPGHITSAPHHHAAGIQHELLASRLLLYHTRNARGLKPAALHFNSICLHE